MAKLFHGKNALIPNFLLFWSAWCRYVYYKDMVTFSWYFIIYIVHLQTLTYLFLLTTLCVRANTLLRDWNGSLKKTPSHSGRDGTTKPLSSCISTLGKKNFNRISPWNKCTFSCIWKVQTLIGKSRPCSYTIWGFNVTKLKFHWAKVNLFFPNKLY